MNYLLIAVIVIIAAFTFKGYRKGFVREAVSIVSIILTLLLVGIVTPYISDFLENHTPIYRMVKEKCENALGAEPGQYDDGKVTDQVKAIENSAVPNSVKRSLIDNNNNEVYKILQATGFADYISSYLAKIITNAAAYVVAFLLITVALRMTLFTLDIIANLPVLHGINKLAGLVLGTAEGLIIVWVFFLILTIFISRESGQSFFSQINDSALLSFLYNNNILLKAVTSLTMG